jgi:hypothetical protein
MKIPNWVIVTWTFICIGIGLTFAINFSQVETYRGDDVILTTNSISSITIRAESLTVEAASADLFILRSVGGELLAGVVSDKPLGWDKDEYYYLEPSIVAGDEWILEKGEKITIHLRGPENMIVELNRTTVGRIMVAIAGLLIGLMVWIIGMWLLSEIEKQ